MLLRLLVKCILFVLLLLDGFIIRAFVVILDGPLIEFCGGTKTRGFNWLFCELLLVFVIPGRTSLFGSIWITFDEVYFDFISGFKLLYWG